MGTDVGRTGRFSLFAVSKDRKLSHSRHGSRPGFTSLKALRVSGMSPVGERRSGPGGRKGLAGARLETCLLYTSDAADEEDSVDLGGRRIIKKKKKKNKIE